MRFKRKNISEIAVPLAMPGKKPPRVTSAVSISVACTPGSTNGPKAKPIDEPLLRPPNDKPKRIGNQSTNRYSTPPASRGVVATPKPVLKA